MIGNRIALLRENMGITQLTASEKLGITRTALSHYENNRREPHAAALARFADLYGVTVDYLVGRTSNPQQTLTPAVRSFIDELELSEETPMSAYTLTVDGKELTLDEKKRFIAFIRAERAKRNK